MESKDSHKSEEEIPFEERDRIWNLLYQKISEAIQRKQNFAVLFSGTLEGEKSEEGYSAIITEDQYEILLQNFLIWSEEQERYEICTEVNKIIKELKSWKKMN